MPKPTQFYPYTFHFIKAVDGRFRNGQFFLLTEKIFYLKLFHITRHRVPIKIHYTHGGVYHNLTLVIRTRLVFLFLLFVLLSYVIIYLKSSILYVSIQHDTIL